MNNLLIIQDKIDRLSKKDQTAVLVKLYKISKQNRQLIDQQIKNPIEEKITSSKTKDNWSLIDYELSSFEDITDEINEYGISDEDMETAAGDHLASYLDLVNTQIKDMDERKEIFLRIKKYIESKNNMFTDYMDEIFEERTDMSINR